MSMVNILFFISGCVITSVFFLWDNFFPAGEEIPIRKGLLKNTYTSSFDKENVNVVLEIAEIDSTETKSKIRVINMSLDKSRYNTESYRKTIISMVNDTWVDSNEIEWLNKSKSKERAEKLDKILN